MSQENRNEINNNFPGETSLLPHSFRKLREKRMEMSFWYGKAEYLLQMSTMNIRCIVVSIIVSGLVNIFAHGQSSAATPPSESKSGMFGLETGAYQEQRRTRRPGLNTK